MANGLFTSAKGGFLAGTLSWSGDLRIVLVDHADDTPVQATDDNLDDILVAARVATSAAAMTALTTAGGIADAADVTLSSVTGDPAESIVIYKVGGTEATSPLIAMIDTATGLPVTPNGGNITVAWDNGTNKIFAIAV